MILVLTSSISYTSNMYVARIDYTLRHARTVLAECVCLRFQWCEGVRQTRQKRRRPGSRLGLIRCELRNPVRLHFLRVFSSATKLFTYFWKRVNMRSKMAYSGWISTKGIELRQGDCLACVFSALPVSLLRTTQNVNKQLG